MNLKNIILVSLALLLSSCSSNPGSNKSVLSPSTWFSDAPLRKLEKNEEKSEKAKEDALRRVQILTLEQSIGLANIPTAPGLNHIIHSNRQSLNLLDQLNGPVSPAKFGEIAGYMGLLLSQDDKEAGEGLELREKRDRTISKESETIAKLRRENEELTENLKKGFERENNLANAHRTAWATFYWIAGGAFVLFLLHSGLPLLANVFPVLSGISRTVTAITSPGLTYVEKRGAKMAEALGEMLDDAKGEEKELLVSRLDQYLDSDHKAKVKRAKNRLASKRNS